MEKEGEGGGGRKRRRKSPSEDLQFHLWGPWVKKVIKYPQHCFMYLN